MRWADAEYEIQYIDSHQLEVFLLYSSLLIIFEVPQDPYMSTSETSQQIFGKFAPS